MRSQAPALMPIFRSPLQGKILTKLLTNPDTEYTLTELADAMQVPLSTVQGETNRLIEAGLILSRQQGRNRLMAANTTHPAAAPLTQLALLSFGPHEIIAREFSGINGVERVVIFGSWAARYAGNPGPPPRDIDVLIVGDVSKLAAYSAAERAQQQLGTGIEINPIFATHDQWETPGEWTLMIDIHNKPHLTVYPHQELAQ